MDIKHDEDHTSVSGKKMKPLGIYIHIPFCVKKCDYCDFLSAPASKQAQQNYVQALKREIEQSRDKMKGYLTDTVFIGGGTPSILEHDAVAQILNTLKENCRISESAEITVECNPGTVSKEKLLSYRRAGVNRLSFGLQSADNEELRSIGRIHTFEDFLRSYQMAADCGFENINVDLMSALPGQSIFSYEKTLNRVVNLQPKPTHISAYSLIVEEGTPLKERVCQALADGKEILPNEEEERRMYDATKSILENAGYRQYEISNYALGGFLCRHNAGYWKRKEYLGFGIGAASLYQEQRYHNLRDLNSYIDAMTHGKPLKSIQEDVEALEVKDRMAEFMFLGLRMTEGISMRHFSNTFGVDYDEIYGSVTKKLIEAGLLQKKNDFIRLTKRGIDISNYVMVEFLPES